MPPDGYPHVTEKCWSMGLALHPPVKYPIFVIVILGYIFDSSFNNFPPTCLLASSALSQSRDDYVAPRRLGHTPTHSPAPMDRNATYRGPYRNSK